MQQEFTETSTRVSHTTDPRISSHPRHGSHLPHSDDQHRQGGDGSAPSAALSSGSGTPRSVSIGGISAEDAVNAYQLDEKLRRLSGGSRGKHVDLQGAGLRTRLTVAGQRISEYENALTPLTPRQSIGFKVVKRPGSASDGTQLIDFPNEILTHIFSHMHPDSHASVALVCKRFYALVTTPHAWRMAFLRQFPGQEAVVATAAAATPAAASSSGATSPSRLAGAAVSSGARVMIDEDPDDRIRSETRSFARLTALASWRSEYLLRTRLLRSVARGKPGGTMIGTASRSASHRSSAGAGGKRVSAVLTYNSKLPWTVSHIDAVFSAAGAKRPPRAIHGSADLCVATLSDPTSGKVERWGIDDTFSFQQLDEVFPHMEPYGLEGGPAATLNVMDVSQPFGVIGGEGFPGGRPFFRPVGESQGGRYLGSPGLELLPADVPAVPFVAEAICAVWIAKTSVVPSSTQSMVGMMTGSTLGVVTAYSLGYDSSGPRYDRGDMTCRWVLSPGVPIVALKLDDSYSPKRKALRRVWAAALNALGEVFYLIDTPSPPTGRVRKEDMIKNAWYAGRTARWELVECTRRTGRSDEFDKGAAARRAYSPGSPVHAMALTLDQLASEARKIETFMHYPPSHFREACSGWDMRRRLETDFGGDDGTDTGTGNGAGEAIVVVSCGLNPEQPPRVRRYTRFLASVSMLSKCKGTTPESSDQAVDGVQPPYQSPSSIFGSGEADSAVTPGAAGSPGTRAIEEGTGEGQGEWRVAVLELKVPNNVEITAIAMDNSMYATMGVFETPLDGDNSSGWPGKQMNAAGRRPDTPIVVDQPTIPAELPGKRARLFAVGTSSGAVVVWNVRDKASSSSPSSSSSPANGGAEAEAGIAPVRTIQTESPEISCLALSALYLVHGGSDGLVQAWDPLASTADPVRTLNSRSSGRLSRAILNANPMLRDANHAAVGAICLDPDPAVLRGLLAFGTSLRYWSYSSTGSHHHHQRHGRKHRSRNHQQHAGADVHGQRIRGRGGSVVLGYIAAEEAELRREQEHRARETARLRSRFGVGLGDLTDEEAVRYAEMVSQESFAADERLRRGELMYGGGAASDEAASVTPSGSELSASVSFGTDGDGSCSDAGGSGTLDEHQRRSDDTLTPDPSGSVVGGGGSQGCQQQGHRHSYDVDEQRDTDYERQIQRAIRLSLLEAGVNDTGESPRTANSGSPDFVEFQIRYKSGGGSGGKKPKQGGGGGSRGGSHGGRSPSTSPSTSQVRKDPVAASVTPSESGGSGGGNGGGGASSLLDGLVAGVDDDLELALRLSLEEAERGERERLVMQQRGQKEQWWGDSSVVGGGTPSDGEYPALGGKGKGKGKGRAS